MCFRPVESFFATTRWPWFQHQNRIIQGARLLESHLLFPVILVVGSGWFRRNVKIGNYPRVLQVSIFSIVRWRRECHIPVRDCWTRGSKV